MGYFRLNSCLILLLADENVISLRTAVVLDDGHFVSLRLIADASISSVQRLVGYERFESTILFRHERSVFERTFGLGLGTTLRDVLWLARSHSTRKGLRKWRGYFALRALAASLEMDVRPMVFRCPPDLKLLWAETGHSVALLLNGEPWAFIHEAKRQGYSRGILRPTIGNPWDQALFEETFQIE